MTKDRIIIIGLIVHLLTAIFSVGYHQCDELFQVFEFAGYKLGLNQLNEMPWEFNAQMRSGLEPLLVFCSTKIFWYIGISNPFHIALFLRVCMALFSFCAAWLFLNLAEQEFKDAKFRKYLWVAGLLFWCLPYFHVRLSSENFSSSFFLLALGIVISRRNRMPEFLPLLLAGFLFGIAFVCRFQFAFMLAGFFGWLLFIQKPPLKFYWFLLSGLILALSSGILIDKWLYNNWVLSWWNYLAQNMFENKASAFGESPVYFYFTESLLQLIPPFSLIIIAALIAFWIRFRSHYLTWLTLPFIALHFIVAHKELRFLFPVLNFIPVMVLMVLYTWNKNQYKLFYWLSRPGVIKFAFSVNLLLLCFFSFKPADETSQALEKIFTLVKGENPVLLYEEKNPYNNQASLNYFRNTAIRTCNLIADTLAPVGNENVYLYVEKFGAEDHLEKGNRSFTKIYSSFPHWFRHLNFNGWLNRANCYSIYKERL